MKKNPTERVYILPSKIGWVFIVGVLALLNLAIGYDNSLIYIETFLVGSVILLTLIRTHFNLAPVKALDIITKPNFVGKNGEIRILIKNQSPKISNQIEIEQKKRNSEILSSVPPHQVVSKILYKPIQKRGYQTIEKITLSSVSPLGIFRAWKPLLKKKQILGYCEPKNFLPWPQDLTPPLPEGSQGTLSNGEDFSGHRPYQKGEAFHRIDWKAFARGRPLLIKEFQTGGEPVISFELNINDELDLESQLSQLTAWVIRAEKEGISYGLKMPEKEIPPSSGSSHYHECLKELATYENPS